MQTLRAEGPALHQVVEVEIAGASVRTRVGAIGVDRRGRPATYSLRVPADPGVTPRPGDACRVAWSAPNGLWTLEGRFEGATGAPDEPWSWVFEPVDGARRLQRRAFVRVPWAVPVALRLEPTDEPITGMTVDISEGGCASVLPRTPVGTGTEVTLTLTLDGDAVDIPASVLGVFAADVPERQTVVAVFDDQLWAGDLLRPLLFRQQARNRAVVRQD